MHKIQLDLLRNGRLILHDNTCRYMRKVVTDFLSKYEWEVLPFALYSPDISLLDFDLLHKLKEPEWGHLVSSLEELSEVVTKATQGLNKCGTLIEIANLPKQRDVVIDKQGGYIGGF